MTHSKPRFAENYINERAQEHREDCTLIALLINDLADLDYDVNGEMVSDALALAGLNLMPMVLPPWMLFQEAYCKGDDE